MQISSILEKFPNSRILCIGDVMLDFFVTGDVTRVSPEAPIPVLHMASERAMVGGAGNVVRNISALGGRGHFMGAIGADSAGESVRALLEELPGIQAHLILDVARKTTQKTRYIAQGQQLLRVDRETPRALTPTISAEIIKQAEALLAQVDICIFSDYAKGLLTEDLLQHILQTAQKNGIPTIVDPKGADYSRYAHAAWITPNKKELQQATGRPLLTEEDMIAAAQDIRNKYNISNVLVTRSAEGMTLVSEMGVSHLPVQAKEVFDVSGAGDTVVATLAMALAAGATHREATQLANMAGGIVVGKTGTATVSAGELQKRFTEEHREADRPAALSHKVMSWEEAQEQAHKWRLQGVEVGFTNGCFDLLHPGHISLLKQARAAADVLIVGLNSDASVRRLKGETRPIQSEMDRATVLAALSCVDGVVIFDEDTPLELIQALCPHVLVKGADYTIDKVVGADFVLSHNGRVVLADLEPGKSTTRTVQKISGVGGL